MAYTTVPTVATGDIWTAANHNTYIRDNFAAGVPGIFTSKGDIPVATASQVATRLAVGSNGQVLTPDSTDTNGVKWKNYPTWVEYANSSWNGVTKNIGVYTVNASDWTGVPSAGVGAVIVGILGEWTAANKGYFLSARKVGSGLDYVIVRAQVANMYHDNYGVIPLVNGQFDLKVDGANANYVMVKIYGYFPG